MYCKNFHWDLEGAVLRAVVTKNVEREVAQDIIQSQSHDCKVCKYAGSCLEQCSIKEGVEK